MSGRSAAGDGADRLGVQTGNVLPGIPPLAPTFAVIALLAVGAKGDAGDFRYACLAGMKTIPAYLAFLGACWLFIDKVDYCLAVASGIAVWLAAALAIFLAPRYLCAAVR
ncbi:GlpM family protein [Mesorhizobium sp. 43Arga]